MKINAVFLKKQKTGHIRVRAGEADRSLLTVFSVIILSMLCGALAYSLNKNAFSGELWNAFVSYMTNKNGKSLIELFSGLYIIDLFTLLLLTIFGTASFGFAPAIATIIFRTTGIGTIGSYLFSNYTFVGLKYFYLIILPGKIFLFFGLMLAAQNCLQTGKKIKLIVGGKTSDSVDKKLFLFRNTVSAIIFALSALTDALLMYCASSSFNF